MMNIGNGTDLIAFSSDKFGTPDLRTSHIMREQALSHRVFFFEKPVLSENGSNTYYIEEASSNLFIIHPYVDAESSVFEQKKALLGILRDVISDEHLSHYSMWTDTPTAMHFIRNLTPEVIVYDCLRDYSKANPELERELLEYADEVITTGLNAKIETGPLRMVSTGQFRETYFTV